MSAPISSQPLRLVIRTPHQTVLDGPVRGARVPTESGQVGLRPRGEPLVLVVEPGLLVLRTDNGLRFAATAGGLLEHAGMTCTLLSPFAVVGADEAEVLGALEGALATPDSELAARRRLGELEQRIVKELGERQAGRPGKEPP